MPDERSNEELAESVTEALDCGIPLLHKEDRLARRKMADDALAELARRLEAADGDALTHAVLVAGLAADRDKWKRYTEQAEAALRRIASFESQLGPSDEAVIARAALREGDGDA